MTLALTLLTASAVLAVPQVQTPPSQFPAPMDAQKWQDQDDMTWADYKPIPGTAWGNPATVPGRALKVALIAIDFEDQPFVITQPKQSDPFGNPQIDGIPRAQVPQFYADFYGKPSALNQGHTIREYWMEQTHGRIGMTLRFVRD